MMKRALALALLIPLAGCSLVMKGTSQEVRFVSDPPGATLLVAGQTLTTPASIELPKTDHALTFRRPGYEDAEVRLTTRTTPYFYGGLLLGPLSLIDIVTGAWQEFETPDVTIKLVPLPGTLEESSVSITSDPPDAEVVVAGVSYGRTPRDLVLQWKPEERQKDVTVQGKRYKPRTLVLPRTGARLHFELEPIPVEVRIQVTSKPEGADVYIEGRLQGRTPLIVPVEWRAGDGPKGLEFRKDGHHVARKELLESHTEVSARLEEVQELSLLALKVFPPEAQVEVDGASVGESLTSVPLNWSISATRHTLKISHPGYATRTIEVKRDDTAKPLDVRLSPVLKSLP